MKKFFVSMTLLFSVNAMAIDLSNDQVTSPSLDATVVTEAIASRNAISISPVVCKMTGTSKYQTFRCSTTRLIGGAEEDLRQQSFGCMFEYQENADGVSYTRTTWECPIL